MLKDRTVKLQVKYSLNFWNTILLQCYHADHVLKSKLLLILTRKKETWRIQNSWNFTGPTYSYL